MRAALLMVLVPCLAFADAVSVSLNPKAIAGQSFPSVNVLIEEPIAGFWLKLKRSDGKDVSVKGGGRPGQTRVLELQQPEGKYSYKGELLVNFKNGTSSTMPLEFDAEVWGSLNMKIDKKDVDVKGRRLKLTMNRPCDHFELKVMMDTGSPAINGEVPCKDVVPGKPFELTWPEASGDTVMISVKAFDGEGFHFGPMEFFPWHFDVPHEEVNFDSAKWDVRDSEAPKLEKAYRLIDSAVTRCGGFADIKLYVVGYTDTVGGKDYNKGLSLNRARSLGAWFRHRGVQVPIFYTGYGEDALLVATPDETDEVRNRRAQYILSIDPPDVVKAPYAADWKKL
jgi:hypothetical protein